MKRIHIGLDVKDLERSIAFYSNLFGAEPSLRRPDYAKWMLDDPRINFSITSGHCAAGDVHFGIQVESEADLAEVAGRLKGAGEAVLDVGCGGGFDLFVAGRLVGPGGRAHGIDLTPEMVARAGQGLAQAGVSWARVEVGSAEEIPCAAASFDMVLSNGALNLSPDKERAFHEIYRVLRPGGRLHFADIVQSGQVPREAAGDPDAWSQ